MPEEYLHRELTEKIIGCAFQVHNSIGPGFHEVIYEKALQIALQEKGLKAERQLSKNIFFSGQLIGSRRVDILVEDKVIVEVKAVFMVDPVSKARMINYLKLFGYDVALLLNFGKQSLDYKRYVYTQGSA